MDKKSWLDKAANVRMLMILTVIICIGLFVADFFFHRQEHPLKQIPWEGWYGFYAIYGFLAYSFIVIAAHGLRKLVMRKDDYYDR